MYTKNISPYLFSVPAACVIEVVAVYVQAAVDNRVGKTCEYGGFFSTGVVSVQRIAESLSIVAPGVIDIRIMRCGGAGHQRFGQVTAPLQGSGGRVDLENIVQGFPRAVASAEEVYGLRAGKDDRVGNPQCYHARGLIEGLLCNCIAGRRGFSDPP